MRRFSTALMLSLAAMLVACQGGNGVWFTGDAKQAAAVAAERGTLVMMEFYTDWCSWCRRLHSETFTDPRVVALLETMVPLRVNAEDGGEELARRYGVDSYPTIVFVDSEGNEVDRILGYLPPNAFVERAERIRAGDTFISCLDRLSEDPADASALVRSVSGLLERSDPEGAIARIKAYHHSTEGHVHDDCSFLMFKARAALQTRLYGQAAKQFGSGWSGRLIVPETDGTRHLRAILDDGVRERSPDEQAELLRASRYDDAAALLASVDIEGASAESLLEVGDFAFQNGHYDLTARAYERWFDEAGDDADPDDVNNAAWQLYLVGRSLDTAVRMARAAYERNPTSDITDTLARVLYVTGEVDEAIELERQAAARANEVDAEFFRDGLDRMKQGRELGDRPVFESYPGDRSEMLLNRSASVL